MQSLFDKQFDFLIKEFGTDIYLNNKESRAIIVDKTNSITTNYYEDKRIYTKEELLTGDSIFYNNTYWYVMNQKETHSNYSTNIIRRAEWMVNFYPIALKNTSLNIRAIRIPSMLYINSLGVTRNEVVGYAEGKMDITTQDNTILSFISLSDRIIKFNKAWKVVGINNSIAGLVTYNLELDDLSSGDDLEKEIPNGFNYEYTMANMSLGGATGDGYLSEPIPTPITPSDEGYELRFEDNKYKLEYGVSHIVHYVNIYKDGVFIKHFAPQDGQLVSSSPNLLTVSDYGSFFRLTPNGITSSGSANITAIYTVNDYTYTAIQNYSWS